MGTPDEQARKLRAAESAIVVALQYGCTEAEVRAVVESGIAEGHRLNGPQPVRPLLPAPQRSGEPSVIAQLAAAVGVR